LGTIYIGDAFSPYTDSDIPECPFSASGYYKIMMQSYMSIN